MKVPPEQVSVPPEQVSVPPEPAPVPTPSTTIAPSNVTTTTTTSAPSTTHATSAPPTKPPIPTTTPSTTTSTTAATTTVPTKPTPKPKPETGTWTLDYPGTNTSCVVLKMALKIEIPYETNDNKISNATVVVPKTANSSGTCEHADEMQKLILSWKPTADSGEDSITFSFHKNDTIKKFMLSRIDVNLIPDSVNFPNSKRKYRIYYQ